MAFVLKDSEKIFSCYFGETSAEQFTFLATNCDKFFIEKISCETLMNRVEDMNDSIRYKQTKVIKTIKEEQPESCEITLSEDSLKVVIKFVVNNLPLKVFFECSKCVPNDVGQFFTIGFMKLAIEQSLIISKMKKVVEAKDLEIEEYKLNGATLIRESLATKKFDFNEVCQLSSVKLNDNQFTLNPSSLLKEANIPNLCLMIHAENVLNQSKEVKKKQPMESQIRSTKSKSKSRIPVVPKLVEKKFEYLAEEDEEMNEPPSTSSRSPKGKSRSPVPDVAKKARTVKKIFVL